MTMAGAKEQRSITLRHETLRDYLLLPENVFEIDEWLRQLRLSVENAKQRVAEQAKAMQSKVIRYGMVDLEINDTFQRKWCLLGINQQGQAMFCFGAKPHDDTIKYFDQCPNWRQVRRRECTRGSLLSWSAHAPFVAICGSEGQLL